jgi:hypothetical protein
MIQAPDILLLDDGELAEVARILDEFGIPYNRILRGPQAEVAPPRSLLITTPRRAESVRRGSPRGVRAGRPLRIVTGEDESGALRRILKRMGFHLLVHLPAHPEIWRLLVERALYEGSERRLDKRVPINSPVAMSGEGGSVPGTLIDLSNRGCRVLTSTPLEANTRVDIELPPMAGKTQSLHIPAEVARLGAPTTDADGRSLWGAAVIFDEDMPEEARTALGGLINQFSIGHELDPHLPVGLPGLPPCTSRAVPGLTLDEETDPGIRIGQPISLVVPHEEDQAIDSERRMVARGAFPSPVVALGESRSRVLMGRDLSSKGMRIEYRDDLTVGDPVRIAIYGSNHAEPFLIDAQVARDDGPSGLALRFDPLDPALAESLEKLVSRLPEIESLSESDTEGLGAVLSEILEESG